MQIKARQSLFPEMSLEALAPPGAESPSSAPGSSFFADLIGESPTGLHEIGLWCNLRGDLSPKTARLGQNCRQVSTQNAQNGVLLETCDRNGNGYILMGCLRHFCWIGIVGDEGHPSSAALVLLMSRSLARLTARRSSYSFMLVISHRLMPYLKPSWIMSNSM